MSPLITKIIEGHTILLIRWQPPTFGMEIVLREGTYSGASHKEVRYER
jgi:hypothetical protein